MGVLLQEQSSPKQFFHGQALGNGSLQALMQEIIPVIQGGILIIALMVITINFTVDLLYIWANPKMRGKLK